MEQIPVRKITSASLHDLTNGTFSIRKIEQLVDGKDLVHKLHRHNFFFILAVKTGSGVHEIDFKPYEVIENAVFILRPGQVHRLELSADSLGFLVEFDQSFYQPKYPGAIQRWKQASHHNLCIMSAESFAKSHSFLEQILAEQLTHNDGFPDAILANLELFFIEYVRQIRHVRQSHEGESGYMQERFDELMHLLETNIGRMKNASDYAEQLSLSAYQLNSITRASVDKTMTELIIDQIILEAKRYLLATNNQVKDVADHLGYEDPSYFIRFFKKQTGHTPDSFRKNFK